MDEDEFLYGYHSTKWGMNAEAKRATTSHMGDHKSHGRPQATWATTRVAPTITPFELVGPGILGVSCDKSQDALPGVSGSIGIVHGAPIKETMGSARIDDDLVFNACFHQLLFKAVHIAGRNALVGSTKQAEYGIFYSICML